MDTMGEYPYPITNEMMADLENRFTYHDPKGMEVSNRYILIRITALEMATIIVGNSPKSREQSLALTNLEQCVMWANAGIARRS